ncbi:fasciclin-like arabinogalactan protein 9 [Salvia splendens]|uniref:fasciclin-like arabinogalactan protein 9 n=1 Tax=Salvia splendens TaxID=180675 RepID=UPI001C272BD3|nr:fasciclin-like arabinogalactan protein 9 [Salvia splendens]
MHHHAQSSPGPINITRILVGGGQFDQFLRLLNQTWVINPLNTQLNISLAGVTLFAPTNNAFLNLPPGALDNLSPQQRVELVQNHICPKYYSLTEPHHREAQSGECPHRGCGGARVQGLPPRGVRLDKVLMPRFDVGAGDVKAPAENGRDAGAAAGRIGLVAAFWVMCKGLVL